MAKIGGVEVPEGTTDTLGSLSVLGLYDGSTAASAASGTLSEADNAVVNSGALSTYSSGISDFATANAQRKASEGDLAEESAYTNAALIADQQTRLARVSGGIEVSQEDRIIRRTIGEQRAIVAGSGFKATGSAIDIARDSAYQGNLEKALIGHNAEIKAGGYESEAAAARGSAAAARIASEASLELAAAAESSGKMSTSLGALQASTAYNDYVNGTTTTATGIATDEATTTGTTTGTRTSTVKEPVKKKTTYGKLLFDTFGTSSGYGEDGKPVKYTGIGGINYPATGRNSINVSAAPIQPEGTIDKSPWTGSSLTGTTLGDQVVDAKSGISKDYKGSTYTAPTEEEPVEEEE